MVMSSFKVIHVVGARPNFMKVAPVMKALEKKDGIKQILIHTGQHYDSNMSDIFFQQLGIPAPDINLEVGSGSHAVQTAQIMSRIETLLMQEKPDLVLVPGDVNSTMAAAIVCAKLRIPIGHIEAGLRSFDRNMPEEINRLITDQIADFLFTPSADGDKNLLREGIAPEKIHLVGNVMIDTLVQLLPQAVARWSDLSLSLRIQEKKYCLVTLHRPSNVDASSILLKIMETLEELSHDITMVFPLHPRTRHQLIQLGLNTDKPTLRIVEPFGYLDFLALQKNAKLVITDSGGIQEETTVLGVPCLTVRENTERPVTVTMGTNILVGQDMGALRAAVECVLEGRAKTGVVPPLWDGKASERIAAVIKSRY
jgi:UDP-N-acetylglucosamine 2-epimerase (non-hydrolysing)